MLFPTYFACSLNPVSVSPSVTLFCGNNLHATFGTPVISWSLPCPLSCWPLLIRFRLSSRFAVFPEALTLCIVGGPLGSPSLHYRCFPIAVSAHWAFSSISPSCSFLLFIWFTECRALFSLSLLLVTLGGSFSQITQLQAGHGQSIVSDGRVYKLFIFLYLWCVRWFLSV